jgi:hypothetical protein
VKAVAWFAGGVTLLASGAYVFIYLYRWEWHRALFVMMVFVAVEVALTAGLVLRQLTTGGAAATRGAPLDAADPAVLARLRATPPDRDRFAWLGEELGRTHVFITALLGGGVAVSALAWGLDHLAHRTAGRSLDRGLAARLVALGLPADGLVADDAELLASEAPYQDDPDLRLLLGPHGPRA